MEKIYALRCGHKHVSVYHRNRHYVIGFKSAQAARKMHYFMHPEPKFALVRDDSRSLRGDLRERGYDVELELDANATLFVPKVDGSPLDAMYDGGFHMHAHDASEFFMFPVRKGLGIVIPYRLEDETPEELVYKVCVVDPSPTLSFESLNVK